jgi:acetyl esterase/lipase
MFQHLKFKRNVDIKKYFYGRNNKQYILFYMPKKITKNKIIFFINGTGWTSTFIFIFKYIGSFLAIFGYVSIVASHRYVPKYTFPTQIEDIINAIKETLKVAKKNNIEKQFIFMGYSSGAQIVCLLAYSNYLEQYGLSKELISGVVSISGPINFFECKNKKLVNVIKNYVVTLANKESADPYTHLLSPHLKQILCIHDAKDPLVEVANSQTFIEKVNELDPGKGKLIILNHLYHQKILKIFLFPDYNQDLIKWLGDLDNK